jgi:hypothetical protein
MKSKEELDELLALKRLNMLRLSKLTTESTDSRFANRLDNYLTEELRTVGRPMATYNTLQGLMINQNENKCDKSNYLNYSKFKTSKRRERENEMLEGMAEIQKKTDELISQKPIQ